jgi:predicted transcriptional regulator
MSYPAKDEYKHITVRVPVDILDKVEELARAHYRDRSGEIIYALSLYVAAHERKRSADQDANLISLLDIIREGLSQ